MAKKVTEQIKLWGIVQGVGFRPFVAKIAEKMKMKGEVLNIGGLVEIVVTDSERRIDEFLREIPGEAGGRQGKRERRSGKLLKKFPRDPFKTLNGER